MSIGWKLLRKTGHTVVAVACVVGLSFASSACISPDLEPPGASATPTLPGTPGATQQRNAKDESANAGADAQITARAAAGTTGAAPSTMAMAAAGQGARPAMGATAPAQQPTTPPAMTGVAGTSGAAGAAAQDTGDADAGTP